jgi:PLD-like domain
MSDLHVARSSHDGLSLIVYRGEDMALLAFDIAPSLRTPDFVGFGIEYQIAGKPEFFPVYNFLTFNKLRLQAEAFLKAHPNEPLDFSYKASMRSPIQRFRWIHVPSRPIDNRVTYRASAMYWNGDNQPPVARATTQATIDLGSRTRGSFLNIGFTRGYATSQAYLRNFPNGKAILPKSGTSELAFATAPFEGVGHEYPWLGFEARRLLFDFLQECTDDTGLSVDAFVYDLSDPELVGRLQKLKKRLRILIDNSGKHGHADSDETEAAARLAVSAGAANVARHKFSRLQHNKVLIAKRNGQAFAVLTGSTNFSLRGLYIQANNALLFRDRTVAQWYADDFAAAFPKPAGFRDTPIATRWFSRPVGGAGRYRFCFSPHTDPDLSMKPVSTAITNAKRSIFYAIAFRGAQRGAADIALNAIDADKLLVMGVADKPGKKNGPPGTETIVQLPGRGRQALKPGALKKPLPEPFKSEWAGGSGVRMHHKFIVCDFNRKSAIVYTGSSNLAAGGEHENGDNLIEIRDPRVATAYGVEAVRIFDHYEFRDRMARAKTKPKVADLAEPPAGNEKAWWETAFEQGHYKRRDRELFSKPSTS